MANTNSKSALKVPTVPASETTRPASSRSRSHSGGPLTKRNTMRAQVIGAPGAPDVTYRAITGQCETQRTENGWVLRFDIEGKMQPALGEDGQPAIFQTSDLALNFAARTLGLTDKPLDVTAGKGSKASA